MTERKDIGARLENWARWCFTGGSRGADCMTGAICESMRRAALGDVWSGHQVGDTLNDKDAMLIERCMRLLQDEHRLLLWWCYIKQQHPGYICRQMSFRVPEFTERFRAAQNAIEEIVDSLQS